MERGVQRSGGPGNKVGLEGPVRVGCQGMRDAWNLGFQEDRSGLVQAVHAQRIWGVGVGKLGVGYGAQRLHPSRPCMPTSVRRLGPRWGRLGQDPGAESGHQQPQSHPVFGDRSEPPRPVSPGTASAHPDPNLPARSPAPGSSKPLLLQPRKVPGPGRRSCRRGPGKTPPPTVPEVAAPTLRSDCTSV